MQIAAGPKFFNQDPKIIRFVMQNPSDRVTYGDLRMIRSEFEELMQLSLEAGTIKHPIPYEKYVDERFARNARPAAYPPVKPPTCATAGSIAGRCLAAGSAVAAPR